MAENIQSIIDYVSINKIVFLHSKHHAILPSFMAVINGAHYFNEAILSHLMPLARNVSCNYEQPAGKVVWKASILQLKSD